MANPTAEAATNVRRLTGLFITVPFQLSIVIDFAPQR
jgi:hypothetical protein